ncbi:MAG: glycosyltransferase family 1 protein [Bacteroidota bacterium]
MDTKRKRIAILFTYVVQDWIGGGNYMASIVHALNTLPDTEKPMLLLVYNDISKQWAEHIDYPYLELSYQPVESVYKKYIKSYLTRTNQFIKDLIVRHDLDVVYPFNDYVGKIKTNVTCRYVAWFPDFQHKFYPAYFSKTNLWLRDFRLRRFVKKGTDLVLSSEDAASHLRHFYKIPPQLKVHVLPFVSMIDMDFLNLDGVLKKYNVPAKYFIVSNQFYKHKNHKVVFDAIVNLKAKQDDFLVVFTGKMEDYRNPQYIDELLAIIKNNGLEANVRMLGVIPRKDQLWLMKNSLAVIQPSTFEGWSTVVEDAKTIQQQIILSNINVHQEQMGDRAFYFELHDAAGLAVIMEQFITGQVTPKPLFTNYDERVRLFASRFAGLAGS